MNIFLDIETIPSLMRGVLERLHDEIRPPGNMSKPETIAAWERDKKALAVHEAWLKTSFDGALGQVVVIAFAVENRSVHINRIGKDYSHPDNEKFLLEAFLAALRAEVWAVAGSVGSEVADTPPYRDATVSGILAQAHWVGHYVGEFDLRFLFQRMVVHKVKPPQLLFPRDRFRIFDTMTEWAGWGKRCSLDSICQALGIEGKGSELGGEDIDGSKVWEFVQAGRLDDVATYCGGDVERARQIFKRLTFA